jgi:homoserine acetyltransferase
MWRILFRLQHLVGIPHGVSVGEKLRDNLSTVILNTVKNSDLVNGNYEMSDPPINGLAAARMSALLTYRSRNSFESRFGRKTIKKKQIITQKSEEEIHHNEGDWDLIQEMRFVYMKMEKEKSRKQKMIF